MIVEYIRYELRDHDGAQLEAAYHDAGQWLQAAPECLGYDLCRCTDAPGQYVLRIIWRSAEAHMVGFRKGPHFPPFLNAVRPFIDEIAEMRHYTQTASVWRRQEAEKI